MYSRVVAGIYNTSFHFRCFSCLLFIHIRVLHNFIPNFPFFQSTAQIDELPLTNTPEVFGLHPNAEIGYYTLATREMWGHLIDLQPQTGQY